MKDQIKSQIKYDDESLDWVVLVSNNILNVRDEWLFPPKQRLILSY